MGRRANRIAYSHKPWSIDIATTQQIGTALCDASTSEEQI
jgi:hypothetical protein